MIAEWKRLLEYRRFLEEFTLQQLRTRYRGSILGFLWTLLNPLLVTVSFTLIFAWINRIELKTYAVYFFSGYVPWSFFLNATLAGTMSLVSNAHYISKVYVPKSIFPAAVLLTSFVDFGAGWVIALPLMILFGAPVTKAWLLLPVFTLVLAAFIAGVILLFATVTVFLRDFQFLWNTGSFLMFFFTPVLYPLAKMPVNVQKALQLNPMTSFVRLYQDVMTLGVVPPVLTMWIALASALLALSAGAFLFTRAQRRFYLYL